VADEMVLSTTLIGTEPMVRQRLVGLAPGRSEHGAPIPGRRHPGRPARNWPRPSTSCGRSMSHR